MICTSHSVALLGLEAIPISVDVDAGRGKASFIIVGLPDAAVRESRHRVKSALRNAGYRFPSERTVVSLAPADLRKQGPAYDLPIALGILGATGQLPREALRGWLIVGELSLEGETRPVTGCLPMAAAAAGRRTRGMLVPAANAPETAMADHLVVYGAASLVEAVGVLLGVASLEPARPPPAGKPGDGASCDLTEVRGQERAKRALAVAAAGGHHLLMIGPPGAGKTMLARRLPGLLPPPDPQEAIEAAAIRSVAGLLAGPSPMGRPFRAPHHTVSAAGLLGGGPAASPGEITLAHTGVLLLDELPEFDRRTLNGLRQPLEAGVVSICRMAYRVTFPARVLLVGAMNPCPCGHHADGTSRCRCSPREVSRYRNRVSGPLLDRIDVHLEVPRVSYDDLSMAAPGLSSAEVREMVGRARARQAVRLGEFGLRTNADIPPRRLGRLCSRTPEAESLLRAAVERFSLSARAHGRILRVARTIADLEDAETIADAHLAEALAARRPRDPSSFAPEPRPARLD